MIKFFGCVLVLFASFGMSSCILGKDRERISHARELIDFIRFIKDKVECYSMPIDQIIGLYHGRMLLNSGGEKEICGLSDIFMNDEMICDDDVKNMLLSFAGDFGKVYREQQVKLCDDVLTDLVRYLKGLESKFPARKKTVMTLCFAAGGIILIMLM